jgi:acyl-coenzyme A thioesterase PaaI-like protein
MRPQGEDVTDEHDFVPLEGHGFIGLVGPLLMGPVSGGTGRFRFEATDKHRNRNDVVHGGMLMTFADRSMGYTARQGDMSRRQATVQFDMHFIRPARIGTVIEMDCRIIRQTRSLVFVEGTMTSCGEIVATARGIWKITGRPAPSDSEVGGRAP